MKKSLGEMSGPFYFQDISKNISNECKSSLSDIGIDLDILQLETEVKNLESRIITK